jgi:serine/threonine protein kinase
MEDQYDEEYFYNKEMRLRADKDVFNFYRMSNMLGAGSFGEVWKAVQRETGSHRAIKVIKKVDLEN